MSGDRESWLYRYLLSAVNDQLCTKMVCTTCGARAFRKGLLKEVSRVTGQYHLRGLNRLAVYELVRHLAVLPPQARVGDLSDPIMCVLYDVWHSFGEEVALEEVVPYLRGSWAGEVLDRMIEHHRARVAESIAYAESQAPERVQLRREEKRQQRQEEHQKRLLKQKEKSRIWHQTHDPQSH